MSRKVVFFFVLTLAGAYCQSQVLGSQHWTAPARVTELIADSNTGAPFLSFDGKTLYFKSDLKEPNLASQRFYMATRPDASGAFTQITELTELNDAESWCIQMPDGRTLCRFAPAPIAYVWVSADNLRMYYTVSELGNTGIICAVRNNENEVWRRGGTNVFDELGIGRPSLTGDELEFVGDSARMISPIKRPPTWPRSISGDLLTSQRGGISDSFDTGQMLTELDSSRTEKEPFISYEGLSIYFSSDRDGSDFRISKAIRTDGQIAFENIQELDDLAIGGADIGCPSLSADEKTIYFEVRHKSGGQAGRTDIFYSQRIEEPAKLARHLIEHAANEKGAACNALAKAQAFELEAMENLKAAEQLHGGKIENRDIFRARILLGIAILKDKAADRALQESLDALEKVIEF
jgi:hypothetical protein